jgi:ElaB/YqjD/DUF883 family membrane-anchored ribosome-binding protein
MSEDESVREKATELAERAREKAGEVQQQAGGQLRQQIGRRSTQAGEQVRAVGAALRQTSGQLREQGQDAPARITDQAAERLDSVGQYLRSSDPDRILSDAEDFARRNPWAVAAGAAVVGFIASRFLKASSERRYDATVTDLRPYEPTERMPYEPQHAIGGSDTL